MLGIVTREGQRQPMQKQERMLLEDRNYEAGPSRCLKPVIQELTDLCDSVLWVTYDVAFIQDTVQPGMLCQPVHISLHCLIGRHQDIVLKQLRLQEKPFPGGALVLQEPD